MEVLKKVTLKLEGKTETHIAIHTLPPRSDPLIQVYSLLLAEGQHQKSSILLHMYRRIIS